MTRDLAIAAVAALALHGLIFSFPLAGGSPPARLLIHKPIALSIVHPRAAVGPPATTLTSLVPPALPTHKTLTETRKPDTPETTVISGKAMTSEKSSTKIDASGTKKISKRIPRPEELRPLSDDPEPAEKEISASAGEEGTESAGTEAPVGAVPVDDRIRAGAAETVVVHEAQAGGKEILVSARPRYEDNPPPLYPRAARRRGYEGRTLLRVEVLETGEVGGIEVANSSGFDLLDEAAVRAVKDWHFVPGTKNGKRVRQWVVVPIRFSLK